ncbi:MAG: Sua5 YciO YrdC YwlC family protein [Campylobacterales bacterium]|nr:Sua5 YciO YrdC YwlC family protein [Campylobacterales bacterium]
MNPRCVYLVQTDTTVGFLSQDKAKLNAIKGRDPTQPCLKSVATCKDLQAHARVPNSFKKWVRYAKKTTFLFPNGEALRRVDAPEHAAFLRPFGWMYSTSANPTGKGFDVAFAKAQADVVVEDARGFFEAPPSRLIQLGRNRARRKR